MGTVVDELVVKLRYDSAEYDRAKAAFEDRADKAERAEVDRDKKRDDRDRRTKAAGTAQLKMLSGIADAAKATAVAFSSVGLAVGAALTKFNSGQTEFRKFGSAVGMSNKEVQSWAATVKRLGASESAMGTIGTIAKQARSGYLTGDVGMLSALQQVGIQAGPNMRVEDILASAQSTYRNASAGQRDFMERSLTASGVDADFITMLKSNIDVLEAYRQSHLESVSENKEVSQTVTDALTALGQAATAFGALLTSVFGPSVKAVGEWASKTAQALSALAEDASLAGSGWQGVTRLMEENTPLLAVFFKWVGRIVQGFAKLGEWLAEKLAGPFGWLFDKFLGEDKDKVVEAETRKQAAAANPPPKPPVTSYTAQTANKGTYTAAELMQAVLPRVGGDVNKAAGVVANIMAESSGRTGAVNREGGGIGAHGLFQYRGSRAAAFKAKYGVLPSEASVDQQLDFALLSDDPEERRSRAAAFRVGARQGGSASDYGRAWSSMYERHGKASEDARRGDLASGIGSTNYNIQTLNVTANNPQQLQTELQRQNSVTPYQSSVRG